MFIYAHLSSSKFLRVHANIQALIHTKQENFNLPSYHHLPEIAYNAAIQSPEIASHKLRLLSKPQVAPPTVSSSFL
ncbi:unnamed protein product [Prunus brigantina]